MRCRRRRAWWRRQSPTTPTGRRTRLTVTTALRLTGRITDQKTRNVAAPSTVAACSELLRDAGHERGEDEDAERYGDGGVGQDQSGGGVEHAELEVDGVEAHRHDDAGDHLRDEQHEAQHAAAARAQLGQRVPGRRGEHHRERDRAEPDQQAGAEVRAAAGRGRRGSPRGCRPAGTGGAGSLRMSVSLVKRHVDHPVDREQHERGQHDTHGGLPPNDSDHASAFRWARM